MNKIKLLNVLKIYTALEVIGKNTNCDKNINKAVSHQQKAGRKFLTNWCKVEIIPDKKWPITDLSSYPKGVFQQQLKIFPANDEQITKLYGQDNVLNDIWTMQCVGAGALWRNRMFGQYKDLIYPLYNMNRDKVGMIELQGGIFDVPLQRNLLTWVNTWWGRRNAWYPMAARRQRDFFGGQNKYRPQKGTGKAPQRAKRSNMHLEGGKAAGPKAHSLSRPCCFQIRRMALKICLSAKIFESRMIILDQLKLPSNKPEYLRKLISKLIIDAQRPSVLFIDLGRHEPDEGSALREAYREVEWSDIRSFENLQTWDLLNRDIVVTTKATVEVMQSVLSAPFSQEAEYVTSTDPFLYGDIIQRYPGMRVIENGMILWENDSVARSHIDMTKAMEVPTIEEPFQGEVNWQETQENFPKGRQFYRNEWGIWNAMNTNPFHKRIDLWDCYMYVPPESESRHQQYFGHGCKCISMKIVA